MSKTTTRSRSDLLRQRDLRVGWACLAVGLVIPPIALWGVQIGWVNRHRSRAAATALILLGVGIFAVRFGVYFGIL